MLGFYDNSIQTKTITNIISSTPLPIYDTARLGDYLTKGTVYITDNMLIRCTQSGILGEDALYKKISDYLFGTYYPKFTEKFICNDDYYTNETHRRLGQYLRCVRDCLDIDLMPFYNCWCDEYTSNFYINNGVVVEGSSDYKCVLVPIKLNRTYTLAMDCSSVIKIAPIFCDGVNLIAARAAGEDISLTEKLCEVNNGSNVTKKTYSSFKVPFTISIRNRSEDESNNDVLEQLFQRNEKYLYLLVQVAPSVTTTFIVLEGDYTNQGCLRELNLEYLPKLMNKNIYNLDFLSKQSWSATALSPTQSTLSAQNNVLTYYFGTASTNPINNSVRHSTNLLDIPSGHQVMIKLSYKAWKASSLNVVLLNGSSNSFTSSVQVLNYNLFNVWSTFSFIATTTADTNNILIYPGFPTDQSWAVDDWFNLTNLYVIDLTEIFGEGNEPSTTTEVEYRLPEFPLITPAEVDYTLLSKLDLFQLSSKSQRPFSYRLLEYLLLNVITDRDQLRKNIIFAENAANMTTNGIWSLSLRKSLYDLYMHNKSVEKIDINGFVDKNMESAIQKGLI